MQLQHRHWFATVRTVMNYGMFWLLQCLSEVKCQIYWNLCFVSWQRGIHSNKTFQSYVTNTTSICTKVFMQRWYSAFKRQLSETHSLHSHPLQHTYFKTCRKTFTRARDKTCGTTKTKQYNQAAENEVKNGLLCSDPYFINQPMPQNLSWKANRTSQES